MCKKNVHLIKISSSEDSKFPTLIMQEEQCVATWTSIYPLLINSNPPLCFNFCPIDFPYRNETSTECLNNCGLLFIDEN